MQEKEENLWNDFYKTVGGKYICSECGHIMSWVQYDLSDRISGKGWLIGFLLAFIPVIGVFVGAVYLMRYAPKRGCPMCHVKQNRIYALKSTNGMRYFKRHHPEYAHLINNLSNK